MVGCRRSYDANPEAGRMTLTVQQIQNRTISYEGAQPPELRVRLSLFTASEFQRVQSLRFNDGTGIAIPSLSDQDRITAAHLFGGVPENGRAALQSAADKLADAVYNEGKTNA